MIKKFKIYYNKEDFDYHSGIVDPFKFYSTFYFYIKTSGISNYDAPSKWINYQRCFIICNTLVGLAISFAASYHAFTTNKIIEGIEACSYTMVLAYKIIMIMCTMINKKNYHNLLTCLRKDFDYICTDGVRYRKRYFETQLDTWKICVLFVCVIWGIAISMVFFSTSLLIYYLIYQQNDEDVVKPLPFPIWWFNLDFNSSPNYEIAFIFTNYTVCLYGYVYLMMTQNNLVWVRHITSKADLIIYRLQDLLKDIKPTADPETRRQYDNLIKLGMRDIIAEHHSMYSLLDDYAAVYKKIFMLEQKLCGPVITLSAYCASEKLATGELQGILLLLCAATIMVLLIPSYFCTFLGVKIRSVIDACWDVHFWKSSPVIRPYLVLIMQRSMRPLPLQAAGFAETSLQTFSSVITSAYSMFNMLRQADLNLVD